MKLKFLILALIFHINYVNSQSVSCVYNLHTLGYSCRLFLDNPNGFDGFTTVDGEHVAGFSNADVTIINGVNVTTTNFPSIISRQFVNIQNIWMNFVGIERLDENSFANSMDLRRLRIAINRIGEIHQNTFRNNRKLIDLDLKVNELRAIPDGLFDNLINLEVLNIGSNRFTTLPDEIFRDLHSLTSLDLAFNFLTHLNAKWFENLTNLTELYLMFNDIADLPVDAFSPLRNLQFLQMNNNDLVTLHSDSFNSLPNLAELIVSNNDIDAFDERIIDQTGIRRLQAVANICIYRNEVINDGTEDRSVIRAALSTCFENYREREIPTTTTVMTTLPNVVMQSRKKLLIKGQRINYSSHKNRKIKIN